VTIKLSVAGRRLELVSPAGEGVTASVWQAKTSSEAEPIAVKVARNSTARAQLSTEGEGLLWARSSSLPALIGADLAKQVAGSDVMQGAGVLLLGWVEGTALNRVSIEEPIRTQLALRVATDIGDALCDLHDADFCHGDVKPANILLEASSSPPHAHLVDFGLVAAADDRWARGGTPRYLDPETANPEPRGDGRTRDLWALGIVLAEIAAPELTTRTFDPQGWLAQLSEPIRSLVASLLRPNPGTRPSAAWVAQRARGWLGEQPDPDRTVLRRRERVERAYLAAHRRSIRALARSHHGQIGVTGIARDLVEVAAGRLAELNRLRGLVPEPTPAKLDELSVLERTDFLVQLVGPIASRWRIPAAVSDQQLLERLLIGCENSDPAMVTLAALRGEPTDLSPRASSDEIGLVLRLGAGTLSAEDLAQAEVWALSGNAPESLVIAVARRLRASGEFGRALALLERSPSAEMVAEAAETARRAGDGERVLALVASNRHKQSSLATHRLAATHARLLLDHGEPDRARERLAGIPDSPSVLEVRALAELRSENRAAAIDYVERGLLLASQDEERARLEAIAGMTRHAQGDAEASLEDYRRAVDHAARAGAVLEEATYLTGMSAAAVQAGRLGQAIDAAERGLALFKFLSKPRQAAAAALNRVAALAATGRVDETRSAAELALAIARSAREDRCLGYIHCALADVAEIGSREASEQAERARQVLERSPLVEDRLLSWARAHEHGLEVQVSLADGQAGDPECALLARLDWWGARARRAIFTGDLSEAEAIVGALCGLATTMGPVIARGRALTAGARLAALAGIGDAARRLRVAATEDAERLLQRCSPALRPAVLAVPWIVAASAPTEEHFSTDQVSDIENLVRSLGNRDQLRGLLEQILDTMVLWTGVERGLLLLRAPNGRLVPRAGRNLARRDLVGPQLELSHTLAGRALLEGEPVVAFDASHEMESVHESIHALKLRSVMAIPLIAHGEALGVVYLDDRVRRGAFGPKEKAWVRLVATIAAIAIAEARDRLRLRRLVRRAERAERRIGESLALREAQLGQARVELAHSQARRPNHYRHQGIVGDSSPVHDLLRVVDRVIPTDLPVLIQGESGSGKELVARTIHKHGARAAGAFVAENCGAIPETLLESALFGHVRGAFTGASQTRAGLFEVAHRGTLFLDEIGEMGLAMQAKLLRILEDGEYRPLGSDSPRRVDVRVIAATHRDLDALVEAGKFRQDLLFRLNVVVLRVPPLRERQGDLPLLVDHFLKKHAAGRAIQIGPEVFECLANYRWPGNVRQLENEVRRLIVLADDVVRVEHLSEEIRATFRPGRGASSALNLRRRLDSVEMELVRDALKRTGGNQTRAAELLGVSRFGLQKMMKRLELR